MTDTGFQRRKVTMKRVSCDAPTLDDLLKYASSFDDAKISLDAYQVHQLMGTLATVARARLGAGSVLRLGSVSLRKDLNGVVTVYLKHKGICFLSQDAPQDSSLAG